MLNPLFVVMFFCRTSFHFRREKIQFILALVCIHLCGMLSFLLVFLVLCCCTSLIYSRLVFVLIFITVLFLSLLQINLFATVMRYPGKQSQASSFLVEQAHTYFYEGSFSSAKELGLPSQFFHLQLCLCVLPDLIVIASSIRELLRSFRYAKASEGMKWKPNALYQLSRYLAGFTLLAYAIETLSLVGVSCFQQIPVILVIVCSGARSVQIIMFLLASATQGEFVVMIMTIMFQDMPQFMMIAVVLTFAFSQIFLLLHSLVGSKKQPTTVFDSAGEFWDMFFKNFKHVFGNGFEDPGSTDKDSQTDFVVEVCSLIAALAITIVLVNMLIASMSETFQRVRASKASE